MLALLNCAQQAQDQFPQDSRARRSLRFGRIVVVGVRNPTQSPTFSDPILVAEKQREYGGSSRPIGHRASPLSRVQGTPAALTPDVPCAPGGRPDTNRRRTYSNSCGRVLANVEMPMALRYGRIASIIGMSHVKPGSSSRAKYRCSSWSETAPR